MKHIRIKPRAIGLEASTYCQLKCPSCPNAKGEIRNKLGRGFLKFRDFQALVDKNPSIAHVELSNWGEIFLNPDLLEILKYAYRNNIALTASNGANLNTIPKVVLEALVKYKFRHITCSIDGATQETYSQYRIGGDFDRVIENIKTINHYKSIFHSPFPILVWQFVAFGHNEHEIQVARQLAKSLKMQFWVKLSWDTEISPIKDKTLIERETESGVASPLEYSQKYSTGYMSKTLCSQLWRLPQIHWDGRILGCCINYWGDFGHVVEFDVVDSTNNPKIRYARQMLLGKAKPREDIPCTSCTYYKEMSERQDWLTQKDIKPPFKYRLAYSLGRLGMWLTNRSRLLSWIYLKISNDV